MVVHGEADPFVPFESGVEVAEAIPGARLLALPKTGHDLPPAAAGRLLEAIAGIFEERPAISVD